MGKWIDIIEVPRENRITKAFVVKNKDGSFLGDIQWSAPWRKYAFFPSINTLFDADCLNDIVSFMTKLMFERKVDQQNKIENGK